MKTFDVQSISLDVSGKQAFAYISDPEHLPEWAHAFASVNGKQAVMQTPNGKISVGLDVRASDGAGTIDWYMTFPDGSVAVAYSRVVEIKPNSCAYSFTLTPPPVPLEQLEGALEAQSKTLTRELVKLKSILEHGY